MLIFIDCKGIDVSFFMQYFKMSKNGGTVRRHVIMMPNDNDSYGESRKENTYFLLLWI